MYSFSRDLRYAEIQSKLTLSGKNDNGMKTSAGVKIWGNLYLISLIINTQIHAAVPARLNNGQTLHWSDGQNIDFFSIETKSSPELSSYLYSAIAAAQADWKNAVPGVLNINFWQRPIGGRFLANQHKNNSSNILFNSQAAASERLGSDVLGLTQVWYNPTNGEILESDILLNDIHFELTNDPRDSSSLATGSRPRVYIRNVVTHEMGHALGLTHDAHSQSTMFPYEFFGQSRVHCTDQNEIKNIYDSTSGMKIRVTSESGSPARSVHIQLISVQSRQIIATTITNDFGDAVVQHLTEGPLVIALAPFRPSVQNLTPAYAGKPTLLPGCSSLPRQIAQDANGRPLLIDPKTTNAWSITAKCGASINSSVRSGDYTVSAFTNENQFSNYIETISTNRSEISVISHSLWSRRVPQLNSTPSSRIQAFFNEFASSSESWGHKLADGDAWSIVDAPETSWPAKHPSMESAPFLALLIEAPQGVPPAPLHCIDHDPDTSYQSPIEIPGVGTGGGSENNQGCGTLRSVSHSSNHHESGLLTAGLGILLFIQRRALRNVLIRI